jgi:hypothetical protein
MCYSVLSYTFRVRSSLGVVRSSLDELLAGFGRTEERPRHEFRVLAPAGGFGYQVILDGDVVHRAPRVEATIDWILWKASTEAIAAIDAYLAIHAGAVGWERVGILLPAPHDSGKTTLTAALTASGFSYFSDEAALIDPSSVTLVPFPRALWLEPGSVAALDRLLSLRGNGGFARNGTSHVAPADFRGGRIGRAAPVRHIVFPRYRRGAETTLVEMSRAEAVVELGRNAFNLERFGRRGVDMLVAVVGAADVHRLAMGDLREAVEAIERLVGSDDRRGGSVSRGSG